MQLRFTIQQSNIGTVLIAATVNGLAAILIDDNTDDLIQDLQRRFPKAELIQDDLGLQTWAAQIVEYIENPHTTLDVPLDIQGTDFQKQVWAALQNIPPGKTASYAQIAGAINKPLGSRAIAGACAANHLAVVIPCHRVVRSSGEISGYRWGVERKRELLSREQLTA